MPRRRSPKVWQGRVVSAIESMIPGTMGGRISNASPVGGDSEVQASIQGSAGGGIAAASAGDSKSAKDEFPVAATPASTYTLSAIPTRSDLGSSLHLSISGLEQREGTDYTVDYTTGIVTLDASIVALLATGDVILAEYETTGQLVTTSAKRLVEWAGTTGGSGWVTTDATVGRRLAGVWTYNTIAQEELLDEGIADAYSVESTVLARPVGTLYFNWKACTSEWTGPLTGVAIDTDNVTGATLYLYQAGSPVLSTAGFAVPAIGDTVKLVTDFTTKVATAYVNGSPVVTLDFSSATWFSAGMEAP